MPFSRFGITHRCRGTRTLTGRMLCVCGCAEGYRVFVFPYTIFIIIILIQAFSVDPVPFSTFRGTAEGLLKC